MTTKKIENYLNMINALIKSPEIEFYNIGITKSFKSRKSSYKRLKESNHLYFIDAEIKGKDILKIEKKLFERLTSNKKSINYKKYSPQKRDEPYHNSGGSKKAKEIELIGNEYYLYVAAYTKV